MYECANNAVLSESEIIIKGVTIFFKMFMFSVFLITIIIISVNI